MATKQQRQRRLKRRRDHQIKTRKVLPAVQKDGVVHVFPNEETAIKAMAETNEVAYDVAEALESKAPEGVVVGEDERQAISEVLARGSLQTHSVEYLRNPIAASLNIKGRSKMKKAELIEAILEAQK